MKEESNFKFAASIILIISLMIALMLIVISSSAFSFFIAAMTPTIIAVFLDRQTDRCASGTVCTFNLIGVSTYLDRIWKSSDIDYASRQILSDAGTWFVVCGSSTVGLLLYISLPSFIVKVYEARNAVLAVRYKEQARELSQEWGLNYEE